jgi:hypothetical protein
VNPGQPGLYREILSQPPPPQKKERKKKKKKKWGLGLEVFYSRLW